jgi:shikimate kinase
MNIVLIGFMGTGKSTVGQLLAQQLGLEFIDADVRIESEQGRTIAQIFKLEGEACFRHLEAQLAVKLAANDRQVISTGGGFVLYPPNINVFKPSGVIVALTATPEVIYERVKNERHRPLLAVPDPLARINALLLERSPYYQNADLVLDTSFKKPVELVAEIRKELMRRGFNNGRSQA